MKKKYLILLIILLLMTPTFVYAESTINTSFDDEKCILNISGTQTGHDATISLFNEDNELIGFKTGEITNNNYSIDFVLSYDDDQKINITLSNENGTNEYSKNNVSISKCLRDETEEENNEENYEIKDDNNNSISFTEESGHTFTLTIFDFVGLTDEELEKSEISKEYYNEVLTKITDATKENGELISFYKIEITDENNNSITEGPFKLKIKMTEDMKKYSSFKMIYVDTDNNFKIEEPIIFTVNGDYLEGTLNHLSTYALVGTKSNDNSNTDDSANIKTNPKTGDNIIIYISLLGISIIGLLIVFIYKKKKKTL